MRLCSLLRPDPAPSTIVVSQQSLIRFAGLTVVAEPDQRERPETSEIELSVDETSVGELSTYDCLQSRHVVHTGSVSKTIYHLKSTRCMVGVGSSCYKCPS